MYKIYLIFIRENFISLKTLKHLVSQYPTLHIGIQLFKNTWGAKNDP